jgi:hypothetical protein
LAFLFFPFSLFFFFFFFLNMKRISLKCMHCIVCSVPWCILHKVLLVLGFSKTWVAFSVFFLYDLTYYFSSLFFFFYFFFYMLAFFIVPSFSF